MQLCYSVTNMDVVLIPLGAAFLVWSHMVWIILLMLSLWR